jgi:ketosteroid isomerase-like protein
MRTPSVLFTVAGLTIGFLVPTLAQPKDTADPQMAKQRNLLADIRALDEFSAFDKKYDEAFKKLDASAMAAFYTEDGVVVTPDGWFSGRENIEKWYAYMFQRWRPTDSMRQDDQLNAVGDEVWAIGRWWSTLQSQDGPVLTRGYWSTIFVREGDAWKIRTSTYNVAGGITLTARPDPSAETN